MRIGELVRRTGVNERLLRYYEEQGLLEPVRRASGYREYAERDVATVSRIRCLLSAGLGTATIATLLPCMDEDAPVIRPTCPDVLDQLRGERERLTRAIEDLRTSRALLDRVIDGPAAP